MTGRPATAGNRLWSLAKTEQLDTELGDQPSPRSALGLIDFHDGCAETATLSLRISGESVPPFETTYRLTNEPHLKVGARLQVVVDPPDNLFTLRPL